MKCSRFFYILIVVAAAFILIACSGRPVEQIQMTEKVMQQAKEQHAEEFSAEDWKAGQDDWRDAQSKLEKEKWGEATTSLLKAKGHFEKARDIAKGLKENTIKEIENNKIAAEKRCKTLKESIDAGGKKLPAAKRKEFEEACKAAEEKIAKSKAQLENGQFNDAKFSIGTALRELWETQKDVDKAVGKKTS